MSVIEKAVQWALGIAADNSHGYSQAVRWGPSYDCSSLVISAFRQAGVPLAGATYTGNMRPAMLAAGFVDVTGEINLATGAELQRGDVLLNIVNHTALCIGGGQIVHARSSEGTNDTADNSGNEIRVQPYFLYGDGWDCVLRYAGPADRPDAIPSVSEPETEALVYLPELTEGNLSESVRAAQDLLILRKCPVGAAGADGEFGPATAQAVRNFQLAHDLEADAVIGEKTWSALITGRS